MKKRVLLVLIFSAIFGPPVFAQQAPLSLPPMPSTGQIDGQANYNPAARICDNLPGAVTTSGSSGQDAQPTAVGVGR